MRLTGRKLHPSESYVIEMRHMKKTYGYDPWDWDEDYPEDMAEREEYYPEDIRAIVGIDIMESNHMRREVDKVKNSVSDN